MIQTSTKNSLGNTINPYQGREKKVLTVCSAGLLRSATAQNYLIREHGYNVRNCGTARDFALIPISEALIYWADEIVFMNGENFIDISNDWNENLLRSGTKVITLCVPDMFGFNDDQLIAHIDRQYKMAQEAIKSSDSIYFTVERVGPKYEDMVVLEKMVE